MHVVLANIFQPLISIFEAVLVFFHDNVGIGWGLSIVFMTVVVRAVLLPLTLRQMKSMQSMQRLQPQIKALKAKYGDDKQRLNEETMKFYRENKINPLGSCLPLLAQFPVFIALFCMLRNDLKKHICGDHGGIPGIQHYVATHVPHKAIGSVACNTVHPGSGKFLFINDLTARSTGAVLVVLIILYISSQLVSSLLMSVSIDRNQRLLMLGLPIFFVVFIIQFPTGLIAYWITTNLWTIVQQYIVKRRIGPMRPAPDEPKTSKGVPRPAAALAGGGSSDERKGSATPSGPP